MIPRILPDARRRVVRWRYDVLILDVHNVQPLAPEPRLCRGPTQRGCRGPGAVDPYQDASCRNLRSHQRDPPDSTNRP